MYKNKSNDGKNNICGKKISKIRMNLPEKTSQRKPSRLGQKRIYHSRRNLQNQNGRVVRSWRYENENDTSTYYGSRRRLYGRI